MQALQSRLAEAEEAHEEELVDLQATIQSCSTKLQDTKVLLWGLLWTAVLPILVYLGIAQTCIACPSLTAVAGPF